MTFIVECIVCSQPWEVPTMMVAVPGQHSLQVPEHGMLNLQTSQQMSIPCPGVQYTGIGLGRLEDWKRNWPLRKVGRPLPEVLDGAAVTVV